MSTRNIPAFIFVFFDGGEQVAIAVLAHFLCLFKAILELVGSKGVQEDRQASRRAKDLLIVYLHVQVFGIWWLNF